MDKTRLFLISSLAVSVLFSCASRHIDAQSPSSSLAKILTTRSLWGKAFPAALATIPQWNKMGERTVAVFAQRIVATSTHKTRQEAEQAATKVSAAMKGPQPRPNAGFTALLKEAAGRSAIPFRPAAVQFPDDDSIRLALTAPSLQLLADSLTIQQVREALGAPEKTSSQVIQSERDRRPVVLTLHSYAGGTVAFVESDLSPKRGSVDRVMLDVRAVMTAVFEEAR